MKMFDHPKFRQAMSYAWGRQDSGDEERDTGRSEEFAEAYARRFEAFEAFREGVSGLPNLCAAYEEWRETGAITDGFHRPTRRRLPALSAPVVLVLGAVAYNSSFHWSPPLPFDDLYPTARDHWCNVAVDVITRYAEHTGSTVADERKATS